MCTFLSNRFGNRSCSINQHLTSVWHRMSRTRARESGNRGTFGQILHLRRSAVIWAQAAVHCPETCLFGVVSQLLTFPTVCCPQRSWRSRQILCFHRKSYSPLLATPGTTLKHSVPFPRSITLSIITPEASCLQGSGSYRIQRPYESHLNWLAMHYWQTSLPSALSSYPTRLWVSMFASSVSRDSIFHASKPTHFCPSYSTSRTSGSSVSI